MVFLVVMLGDKCREKRAENGGYGTRIVGVRRSDGIVSWYSSLDEIVGFATQDYGEEKYGK